MWNWLALPEIWKYKDLNIKSLPLNRAYLIANSTIDNVTVYSVYEDCFQCPYKMAQKLRAHEEMAWEVDTSDTTLLKIMNLTNYNYIAYNYTGGLICQQNYSFGEYGVYHLDVSSCGITNVVPPMQPYLALIPCAVIILAIYGIYAFIVYIVNYLRKFKKAKEPETDIEKGITSLNVFRGLLMIILIFTTSGGGKYPIFTKTLGGVSIPDIVFSALSWSIGVQIPYDVDAELASGTHKFIVAWKILQKSIVMVFSSWITDSSTMREVSSNALWSPLKRVAFAYLLVACSYALTARRSKEKDETKDYLDLQETEDQTATNSMIQVTEVGSDGRTTPVVTSTKDFLEIQDTEDQTMTNSMMQMTEAGSDEQATPLVTPTLLEMFLNTMKILVWCWLLFLLILATFIVNVHFFMYLSCTDKTGFKHPKMNYSNVESEVKVRCGYWLTRWVRIMLAGEAILTADVNNYMTYNAGALGILSTILITMTGLKTGLVFVHFKSHSDRLKLWSIWATLSGIIGLAFLLVKPIAAVFLMSSISMYIVIFIYWWTDIRQVNLPSLSTLGFNYLSILFGHLLFSNAYPFTFYDLNNHLWSLLQNSWTTFLWLFKGDYLVKKYMKTSQDAMFK